MAKSPAPILTARSLAVVGATDRSHWPVNIYDNLKQSGYAGPIYLVNPRRDELFGEKCYPDLEALPTAPELALLIIPATAVEGVLASAAGIGVKGAIVYASGIGEGTDPAVIARGEALKAAIATTDISVCGPNCMGLAAIREKLYLYPHTHMRSMEPGSLALITQSGGTLSYFVRTAVARGLRFSYAVSSGNELNVDLSDYVNFLVDDENTKTIALFIEGIRKPDAFMAAAARALAAEKPIVAIKTGRSAAGRQAARSHSGAISGDFQVYQAMCERYGIVNCTSLDDMIDTALAFQGRRFPAGPAIAFMTTSGGTVDLLHDVAEAEGAIMPALSDATVAAIRPLVNADVGIGNPIDTGSPIGATDISRPVGICKAMAADVCVNMLAWCANPPATEAAWRNPEMVKDLLASTTKPVLAFTRVYDPLTQAGRNFQDETGLRYLQGLESTVRALNGLWFFSQRRGRALPEIGQTAGRQADTTGAAMEAALEAAGVTPPASALAETPAEAAAAAQTIGFPVALKIVSPQISHKTEVGGVKLDLRNGAEVEQAATALRETIDAEISGFLVQEMVTGVEMLIGARHDPLYGPMMVVGAGGILVELMKDAAFRLLPLADGDAHAMLLELKAARLLDGYRGRPAADRDALIGAIEGLGRYFLDHRTWLGEVEINPLMVLEDGHGVRAVDIRPVPNNGKTP